MGISMENLISSSAHNTSYLEKVKQPLQTTHTASDIKWVPNELRPYTGPYAV